MPYHAPHRSVRDRIVDIEIMRLERRARSARPSQRDMVVASLLCRPDTDRRDAFTRLFGAC